MSFFLFRSINTSHHHFYIHHKAFTSAHVVLSKERHDELLLAEITEFALRRTRPLSLQRILSHPNPREFLHKELPVRFASRIKQLETLPHSKQDQHILHCKHIYTESFKQLRSSSWENQEDFLKTLINLKRRHANIVPLLVTGARNLQDKYPAQFDIDSVNTFMNNFFLSRIGTEMLTSQYIAKAQHHKPDGIIDLECDPTIVLQKAAGDAEKICTYYYKMCPRIEVLDRGVHTFPYIPQYLYYILFELMKNAMRAVTERYIAEKKLKSQDAGGFSDAPPFVCDSNLCINDDIPPIQVIVSGDSQEVAMKISDIGGGVPRHAEHKIWGYLYTTASPVDIDQFKPPKNRENIPQKLHENMQKKEKKYNGNNEENKTDHENHERKHHHRPTPKVGSFDAISTGVMPKPIVSPLAGFGCGLPLTRLYASYLGGSVRLVSMPLHGTDTYLFLNKIGDTEELVPPHIPVAMTSEDNGLLGIWN